MKTFLLIGLGNKGSEYQKNRHNIGFMALDIISETLEVSQHEILKFSSSVFSFDYKERKIICAKPQTFMNLSGNAVVQIMQFYKIPIENIFVFHDDIDLPNGKIKFKIGGGDGGHNGLKSITGSIGKDYNRVRIGVGRPHHGDVSDFVLSNFKPEEMADIKPKISQIGKHLHLLLEKNYSLLSHDIHLI